MAYTLHALYISFPLTLAAMRDLVHDGLCYVYFFTSNSAIRVGCRWRIGRGQCSCQQSKPDTALPL